MSKTGQLAMRFEDRLYSSEPGSDVIVLTISPGAFGSANVSKIALPRSVGYRLIAGEVARQKAKAEAESAAEGAEDQNEDQSGYDDEDEQRNEPVTLPHDLLAALGGIEVFSRYERDRLPQTLKGFDGDKRDRLKRFADAARFRGGVRDLDFERGAVMEGLDCLAHDYPNLSGVVDFLRCELAIALAGDLNDFRVSPVLLAGEPGIGKTAFCRALSGVLGVAFDDLSAGGGQGGFELCGTSTHFSNCTPGRVFRLLADGESAAPVLLIDEVDKIRGDDRFPILPTLLDLAEQDSAAQFRDECLDLRFDASRVIIVMTANDLNAVPDPLLSRVQVIEVPAPTTAQRRAIAARMLAALPPVAVPDAALDRLAASDADLREVQRRLRRVVGEALARGAREIEADAILDGQWKRRPVGFV